MLIFPKKYSWVEGDHCNGEADGPHLDPHRSADVPHRPQQLYQALSYRALLSYDGTHYFGWQKTKMGPSIQESLEKALLQITKEKTLPEAASRTDRGTHAEGQVIQFSLNHFWEPNPLQKALNAVLAKEIRVLKLDLKHFHPTLDAIGKEYFYKLSLEAVQKPHERLYAWHYFYPLDPNKIERAKKDLLGTHDFSAFSNRKEKNPICTIESIEFDGNFHIRGDRFVYKMVRNIVGTLLYIGSGKLLPDAIPKILESKDRKTAGITAPAHGLYLKRVYYTIR